MDFLDLSNPSAHTVIINFPGRPITHDIERHSHLWFQDKYRTVWHRIQTLWISFIGCPQKYHNHKIVEHIDNCLQLLATHTKDKIVIIMASSAGAGGVIASPVARRIANGMILLNTNPANVWKEAIESAITEIPWWLDLYNGFEDYATHARWAERIAHEADTEKMTHNRIHGSHDLTPEQVLEWVERSLRRRNYIE